MKFEYFLKEFLFRNKKLSKTRFIVDLAEVWCLFIRFSVEGWL